MKQKHGYIIPSTNINIISTNEIFGKRITYPQKNDILQSAKIREGCLFFEKKEDAIAYAGCMSSVKLHGKFALHFYTPPILEVVIQESSLSSNSITKKILTSKALLAGTLLSEKNLLRMDKFINQVYELNYRKLKKSESVENNSIRILSASVFNKIYYYPNFFAYHANQFHIASKKAWNQSEGSFSFKAFFLSFLFKLCTFLSWLSKDAKQTEKSILPKLHIEQDSSSEAGNLRNNLYQGAKLSKSRLLNVVCRTFYSGTKQKKYNMSPDQAGIQFFNIVKQSSLKDAQRIRSYPTLWGAIFRTHRAEEMLDLPNISAPDQKPSTLLNTASACNNS